MIESEPSLLYNKATDLKIECPQYTRLINDIPKSGNELVARTDLAFKKLII